MTPRWGPAIVSPQSSIPGQPRTCCRWLLSPFVELRPSEGSRIGRVYRGAGGEAIPNRGQKTLQAMTSEGQHRKGSWQLCPVTRPPISVSGMVAAGNEVVLSDPAPSVDVRAGETTRLRKKGTVFVVDLWIREPAITASGNKQVQNLSCGDEHSRQIGHPKLPARGIPRNGPSFHGWKAADDR